MTESDWTVGAGVRFVAATRISPCRSLRLSSLDVAIKTFPKEIGAVSSNCSSSENTSFVFSDHTSVVFRPALSASLRTISEYLS